MSSGRVWSFRLSFSFSFALLLLLPFRDDPLPVEDPGNVIPAPLVTGAKSSLVSVFGSFSEGVRKSILKASFFSRLALGAAVSEASADERAVKTPYQPFASGAYSKGLRTSPNDLSQLPVLRTSPILQERLIKVVHH